MNLKLFCFPLFLFAGSYGSCQETDIINLSKITFLNPGFSYEMRIAKLRSIYLQAFMNTSAYFSSSSTFGTHGSVYFDPALTAQYRYYYNLVKRTSKGKRTEMNNLNYFGGVLESFLSDAAFTDEHVIEEDLRPINSIGIVWGIQRNGVKRFSVDFNFGVGYMFAKGTGLDFNSGATYSSRVSRLTTLGQLNLGFWLNKRKDGW